VVEVAKIVGLAVRTVRDIAEQEDIEPTSGRAKPTQVMGEGLLGELVAIVADARMLLSDLSDKIRRGVPADAPKYAAAYAKVLDSVTKLGVAQPVRSIDPAAEMEDDLAVASGGAVLDMGIVRGNDDAAGDLDFEEELEEPRTMNVLQRERLLRTHMERAAQATDPLMKSQRMAEAFGGVPPPSPRELRHMQQVGEVAPEELVMATAGAQEQPHGVPDP
jgi:hypothetical protein